MASPWDPTVLFAGIAAVLASGDRDALVLTPDPDFALPPGAYLDAIGEELRKDPWIRTQTMAGLLRAHAPGTRPVLLARDPAPPSRLHRRRPSSRPYRAPTRRRRPRGRGRPRQPPARDRPPVPLPGREPLVVAARRRVPRRRAPGWAMPSRPRRWPRASWPRSALPATENALHLRPRRAGEAGRRERRRLPRDCGAPTWAERVFASRRARSSRSGWRPGGNQIAVPVVGTASPHELTARLVAGATVLDQGTTSLRFVTVADILPWAALAVLAIILVVIGVWYVRRSTCRSRRRDSLSRNFVTCRPFLRV